MKTVPEFTKTIHEVANCGPFKPCWESLKQYQVPDWYVDGKFGIFLHWGVYSVPGFGNEWYPRQMYLQGTKEFEHHVATYGPQSEFGYKDFIPLFKAEQYDPDHWANLFRKAGAKFVVPVAEHHDGFAMYDCGFSKWCAAKKGPKRDLIGELAEAVRKQWLTFGLSTHRAEHWWFMNGGMQFESDVQDPRYAGLYGPAQPKEMQPNQEYLDDWLARTCELVDKYQPQLVWFDWWIEEPAFEPYRKAFAAYYYNRAAQWGRGVAINYKNQAFPPEAAVYDIERGQLDDTNPHFWQTDTAVAKNSWGYTTNLDYKTSESIIGDLVDIVSKNGALLLNIGPAPDGTIPEPDEKILLDIGKWLWVNGEAIYGTRPWKVFGEGPTQVLKGGFTDTKRDAFTSQDIRFTTRGDALYATLLEWPDYGEVTIQSLAPNLRLYPKAIGNVQLLGAKESLEWTRVKAGLKVRLPEQKPCEAAYVLKVTAK
jgi:alpha-L-fucosidase